MCLSWRAHLGHWPVLCKSTGNETSTLVGFFNFPCPLLWGLPSDEEQQRCLTQVTKAETGCVLTLRCEYFCIRLTTAFPRWQKRRSFNIFNLEIFPFSIRSPFGSLLFRKPLLWEWAFSLLRSPWEESNRYYSFKKVHLYVCMCM